MGDPVTPKHLWEEHGLDRKVVKRLSGKRNQSEHVQRHLSLTLEMRHAADHAQRKVGHEHK